MPETPSCPGCGAPLEVVVGPPTFPPWVCRNGCERAWWDAELTPEARASWSPALRSFTEVPVAAAVQEATTAECEERRLRGTSVTDDQMPLLADEVLVALQEDPGVSGAVVAAAVAEMTRREEVIP